MRPIRSFVCRSGRQTPAQKRAWDILWPQFGISPSEPVNFTTFFSREAPTVLEIGFGNGFSLIHNARQNPEQNYIGVEVFRSGIAQILNHIALYDLKNIRVMHADAVEILKEFCLPNTLDRVQIFFPDPWPKTRHHKRRLIQSEFVKLLASRLKMGGGVHLATDWEHYALQMFDVFTACEEFNGDYIARPESRLKTHFEDRGVKLGHGVWDLLFERVF